MRITQISIKNFRGIAEAKLLLGCHTVFIGDNNSGKSTVLEAIDLVLGPERIARATPIDEHDFYAGRYLDAAGEPIPTHLLSSQNSRLALKCRICSGLKSVMMSSTWMPSLTDRPSDRWSQMT